MSANIINLAEQRYYYDVRNRIDGLLHMGQCARFNNDIELSLYVFDRLRALQAEVVQRNAA